MVDADDRQKRLAAARGVLKPQKLAHVVRRTSRFDDMVRWYCTVLGAEVVHSDGTLAFLTYDDEHHRLAMVETPAADAPRGAPGLDHVAYTLNSLGDLLSTYKRLAAKGILPVWPINHGLTTSLYYEDPQGCRVEFQVENFKTPRELRGFMEGPVFAKNPIGVTFDPAKLAARYEAGDPIEELLKQGATG
jgi:catechol 2,3-dioxygenase-like lactoylglutathione lyase family enzyme